MAKLNVAKIKAQERKVTIEWDGEKVGMAYNRLAITTKFMKDARQQEGESEAEPVSRMLHHILLGWDLVEGDGKTPYPTTLDAIEALPIRLQGALMNAVWEDMNPPEETEKPSGSFS